MSSDPIAVFASRPTPIPVAGGGVFHAVTPYIAMGIASSRKMLNKEAYTA